MSSTPIWFGTADRPCFGWLHCPDNGMARAGVLICPPIGYEYISSHRTLRTLAEQLEERGLVAFRFDYDGTGDSAGDHRDPDRLAAWLATIGHATDVLRSTGVPAVAATGMRLGATLAATAAVQGSAFDSLVLWDPVWSGRIMMRQLRALHQVGVGVQSKRDADDHTIEAAGVRYTAETVERVSSLRFPDLSSTALPVLVLTRPHDPVTAPDDHLPADATRLDATGQEELLDRESSISIVPRATLDVVTAWIDALFSSPETSVKAPPQQAAVAMPQGVSERTVRLGPTGLFGIVTEADAAEDRPTLVLLNNASDHHIGPNRMWVEWGRQMATLGFRVARVDLSGIGDSPLRPGQFEDRSYPLARLEDLAEITADLSDGNGVVLVGLCSGGRIAIDCGPDVGTRGIVAINVAMHTPAAGLDLITHDKSWPPIVAKAWEWHRYRHHIYIRLPKIIWRGLDRIGVMPSVCRPLIRAVDAGVNTLVLWGADEYGLQRTREKSRWALDMLARRPGCRIEIVPDVDHALMDGAGREAIISILTTHLMTTFASVPTTNKRAAGHQR
jgi:dienelactone hydrolase